MGNILRKKLQSDRESQKRKTRGEGRLEGIGSTIEERNSEVTRDSIYDSLLKQNRDSKNTSGGADATSNLMQILEKNLREARKSVSQQKTFIEKIELSKSSSNMRLTDTS